ncbi:MAG: hypothetical protein KF832_18715 [Caldilineaceae bacterium]|nr:hypothetical protein [Caldilineaceae bacterium]
MKTKIQIAVAVLVIVGMVYWAFTSARSYTYRGSNIMFPIGSGHVIAKNTGSEAIPIEMRADGRTTIFRVASTELGLAESARRQGTGRDAFYAVYFELPPGDARIDVTRGSGVQMIARGETPIEALVTPMAANSIRWILITASVVSLWALYYISGVTQHQWLASLRNKLSNRGVPATGVANS